MVTPKFILKRALAEELISLEAEVARVGALKGTLAANRADLIDRLERVRTKAAILYDSPDGAGNSTAAAATPASASASACVAPPAATRASRPR